jgi:hypothetical protein
MNPPNDKFSMTIKEFMMTMPPPPPPGSPFPFPASPNQTLPECSRGEGAAADSYGVKKVTEIYFKSWFYVIFIFFFRITPVFLSV